MVKRMRVIVGTLLIIVSIGIGIAWSIIQNSSAHANGPTPVTQNAFSGPPNCTWWAWQRLHNVLGVDLQFHSADGSNANAGNWINLLSSRQPYAAWSERSNSWVQLQFMNSPAVNDIVVISGYNLPYSRDSRGHVAYVESVTGSMFHVSEQNATGSNWSPPNYLDPNPWSTSQVIGLGGKFIHIVQSSIVQVHDPVSIQNQNGQMEIFQVGNSGQLYYQSEGNHGNWQGWHSLGGSWPSQPVVARNADGRLEIFAVGNQGSNGGGLFHAWQTRVGDDTSWTGWTMMSSAWPAGKPSVVLNTNGELEVFMRGLDSNLYHAWESSASNSTSYSSWYAMGGNWNTDPVVARNANGMMQVFIVGESTQLYYNQENLGGSWSGWQSLGGSWPGQPTVILNSSNELEVFIVGNQGSTGGGLFHAWQNSPASSSWRSWAMLPGAWHSGTPFVAKNSNGLMDVFLVGQGTENNGNTALYHDYENSGGSWSGPQSIGGYWLGEPSVATNIPGGLEVFMIGESGQDYHSWENNAGNSSSYSGWYTLGTAQ